MLRAALGPLSAPNPTADCPDTRTPGQRQHDALRELCRRALAAENLPKRHGLHAKVLLSIGLDQLEARTGVVTTAHGGWVSVNDLVRTAAGAGIVPIVFDTDCTVPGIWCQTAHGIPFRVSHYTGIDDLALLCSYHHHYADNHDWTIYREGGRVWFRPPKWIDPNQTPRTNEVFRPLKR
jgi:hypothetical protein